MSYLIMTHWVFDQIYHAGITIEERAVWQVADEQTIRRNDGQGIAVSEFFKGRHLTIRQARELVPRGVFQLREAKEDDPRIDLLQGWQELDYQNVPMDVQGLQPLADYLKMTIIVCYTVERDQVIPGFYSRCDPQQITV